MALLTKFKSKGNIELLSHKRVALLASRHAPEMIFPVALNLAQALAQLSISIAGGWQSPLEKACLKIFEKSTHTSILYYSATDISYRRPDSFMMQMEQEKRLLFLCTEDAPKRAGTRDVDKRDQLMAGQVGLFLFLFIAANGRLERHFDSLLKNGRTPLVLDIPQNRPYLKSGGIAVNEDSIRELLQVV